MKWEDIGNGDQRAKVFGGWLVRVHEPIYHMTDLNSGDGWDWRVCITLVPDANHEWKIE